MIRRLLQLALAGVAVGAVGVALGQSEEGEDASLWSGYIRVEYHDVLDTGVNDEGDFERRDTFDVISVEAVAGEGTYHTRHLTEGASRNYSPDPQCSTLQTHEWSEVGSADLTGELHAEVYDDGAYWVSGVNIDFAERALVYRSTERYHGCSGSVTEDTVEEFSDLGGPSADGYGTAQRAATVLAGTGGWSHKPG